MRCTLLALIPVLVCGCRAEKPVVPPQEQPAVVEPALVPQVEPPPTFPQEIRLPEAISAKPLDNADETLIYLNVSDQGRVLLMPTDQYKDTEGNAIDTLDNPVQVAVFLKRRAKEDRAAAAPANKNKPLRSLIVLRIDKHTAFEKTYGMMQASWRAGYQRFQFRAYTIDGDEGQITATLPPQGGGGGVLIPDPTAEPLRRYTVIVRAADNGTIEKIILREDDSLNLGKDLGANVAALRDELKAVSAARKGVPAKLTIQIDGKVLHAYVIQLLDLSIQAGFTDISPVVIDPKLR